MTSIVGILVSTYALYVEMAAEARPGYKALCDLSEHASCTRVLTSEFSKGFGFVPEDSSFEVPNCIYGIVFYCIVIFLSTYDHAAVVRLQQFLCLAAVASCVYLAYLLLFVLSQKSKCQPEFPKIAKEHAGRLLLIRRGDKPPYSRK
ncbi:Vitamin K epoxide reductase complex subunit 1-like protein 1 [Papilio xuthus]|uniref:vitamin-K-epoxide reductase (warfarin-sensitive) n=1 Tax=Papilio xuthus TaxID=66420 RepID=A0A194PTJ0_PAPXU|nr:Vitamin K epoxide reductase complex subunit 1-like protein 1 [Papilio xuthus]